MDITLKEYRESINNFTMAAEIYIKYINEYGFSGTYPNQYEIIDAGMKNIEKLIKKLDGKSPKNTADSFELFSSVAKIKQTTSKIVEILRLCEFKEDLQFSFSSSNKQFSYETYSDVSERLAKLEYLESGVVPEFKLNMLAQELANMLSNTKDDDLHSIYKKYDKAGNGSSVVELYTRIIQNRIDEIVTTRNGDKKQINEYIVVIESLKTEALEHEIAVGDANININTIQKLIGRNNLIPSGELKPLSELFDIKFTNFQNLADKLSSLNGVQIYICIINKITPNPMEHKLEPLINKQYLNEKGLLQTSDMGINEKIFIRTNTIIRLQASTPAPKKHIELVHSNKAKSKDEKMYIIETLDGNNYRFLHLWDINSKNYLLPVTWTKLLPDVGSTPSKRMFYYNDIVNNAITAHLTEPKIDINFMSKNEMAKSNTKFSNIRSNIIKELKEKYKPGSSFVKLFSNPKFLGDVISIMANKMVNFDKITNPIEIRELSISYVKDLDNINKKLERELKNAYESSKSSDFGSIMNEVLSKFINSKANLIATIEYKSKMLGNLLGTPNADDSGDAGDNNDKY